MSEPNALDLGNSETQNELVEDGTNKLLVRCKFCGSKILDRKSGKYMKQEKDLPLMQQEKNSDGQVQSEKINEFYFVENMYSFENIGFTHTVDNYKYLSCADCDAGPVGFYDMDTKHSYVALSRVKHE
ncbi:guanine nucleotide exchange factor MSS4 homolog [Zerene cesonia]|uniref:guanine nucleotide exchange factor MSS4 homolog n=1 Tax=Zerene cesonia TaxID=33412 RepID=UPI0018E57BEC|nr:guanine nucleotide exchange factor MSS4 homolog [Zerene cesonia]